MRLGQRGRGHRHVLEAGEHPLGRVAEILFQLCAQRLHGHRGHMALQAPEFFDPLGRQQIDAGGQHLAELDEGRSQILQRMTHAFGRRQPQGRSLAASDVEQPPGALQCTGHADALDHIAEAVTHQHRGDLLHAAEVAHGGQRLPHQRASTVSARPANAAATVCRRTASRSPSNWNRRALA